MVRFKDQLAEWDRDASVSTHTHDIPLKDIDINALLKPSNGDRMFRDDQNILETSKKMLKSAEAFLRANEEAV